MLETFKVPPIRRAHKLDMGEKTCYWFEMDHQYEGENDLLNIFDIYLNRYNWERFIKPGMTVVDIGGHSGDTAVPMQFLAESVVLSIEPNPNIKQYLDFTCRLNSHLGKFVTAGEAVTTEDTDSVTIMDHCNGMCNGGLIDETWTQELKDRVQGMGRESITVPGMTLEHICQKYLTQEEIDRIGFIKTDTEGHDVSILRSSQDFILRTKPVVFTEWFFAYTDVESQELFRVIADMDYLPFYPKTLEPANVNQRSEDLVLIHKDRVGEFL